MWGCAFFFVQALFMRNRCDTKNAKCHITYKGDLKSHSIDRIVSQKYEPRCNLVCSISQKGLRVDVIYEFVLSEFDLRLEKGKCFEKGCFREKLLL